MEHDLSSGQETIHVLVADSTRIHTQLLAEALKRDPGLSVTSAVSDSRGLITAASLHDFDVVVISSNLDEEPFRGFEVLRELRASHPDIRAIMLLDSSKQEAILEAFRAGARGIFTKHESVETLCKCVRRVHEGQIWANSQQMTYAVAALASAPTVRAVDANGFNLLSKRELDVVRSLAEGLTNREIAERLGLSQHTIKNYLFRVFDKLGVSSRIELLFMTLSQAGAPQLSPPSASEHPTNGTANHDSTNVTVCQAAAEQGLPGAQIALAQMYSEGRSVPRDLVTAYMWYVVSETSTDELKAAVAAAKRMLANALTPEEISEAHKRALEYSKKAEKTEKTASRWTRGAGVDSVRLIAGLVGLVATSSLTPLVIRTLGL
jgi:two-component system nitrate/nitrite response regulator NarL